jgi:hypothetical protein
VQAPRLAFGPTGASAVSFAVQDEDNPAHSSPYVVWVSPGGRRSTPERVVSAQQVLASAFSGSTLHLLTGNSPSKNACCSSVAVRTLTRAGVFGRPQTLDRGLAGATLARLVSLPHGMLAVFATQRGVWTAQAPPSGRFGRIHLLTGGGAAVQTMRAVAQADGSGVVAFTETDRQSGPYAARRIFVATGRPSAAPTRAHPVVNLPKGHAIDELALAGGASGLTSASPSLAWIESWFDRHGNYRSHVVLADLSHPSQRRTFAIHGTIASGLAFVDNGRGDQLLAWRTCTWRDTCAVRAALRRQGARFGRAMRPGAIDATEVPTGAVAASGESLVGWIDHGHVYAADIRPHATTFSRSVKVSATPYAADITMGFGATGDALAAWSQGTVAPDVMGAIYRPG